MNFVNLLKKNMKKKKKNRFYNLENIKIVKIFFYTIFVLFFKVELLYFVINFK